MSMLVRWEPGLELGIATIDAQHRKLIELINTMYDASVSGQSMEIGVVLKQLYEYACNHFHFEEQLFGKHHYPEAGEHHAEHVAFVQWLKEVEIEHRAGTGMTVQMLAYLKKWVLNHIQKVDARYAPYLKERMSA